MRGCTTEMKKSEPKKLEITIKRNRARFVSKKGNSLIVPPTAEIYGG